jgi:hypothetical protein
MSTLSFDYGNQTLRQALIQAARHDGNVRDEVKQESYSRLRPWYPDFPAPDRKGSIVLLQRGLDDPELADGLIDTMKMILVDSGNAMLDTRLINLRALQRRALSLAWWSTKLLEAGGSSGAEGSPELAPRSLMKRYGLEP